jgi:copper chaperone CopZ
MRLFVAISALVFSFSALAEPTTFKVRGMHCGACAKSIEEKVCKMEGVATCSAKLTNAKKKQGELTIEMAEGKTLDAGLMSKLVSEAGDYTIVRGGAPMSKTSKKKN